MTDVDGACDAIVRNSHQAAGGLVCLDQSDMKDQGRNVKTAFWKIARSVSGPILEPGLSMHWWGS